MKKKILKEEKKDVGGRVRVRKRICEEEQRDAGYSVERRLFPPPAPLHSILASPPSAAGGTPNRQNDQSRQVGAMEAAAGRDGRWRIGSNDYFLGLQV